MDLSRAPLLPVLVAAVLPAFAGGNASPFGVCAHITGPESTVDVAARCAEGGIRNVRTDIGWYMFQKTPEDWNVGWFQRLLEEAHEGDVTLLPVFDSGCDFCSPTLGNEDGCRRYAEFVARLVREFPDDMPVLEMWNEQNGDGFWPPKADPAKYAQALKAVYKAAKEANPDIRVSFGGLSGVDVKFIELAYLAGAKGSFDIMSVHPYCNPNAPEGWLERQLGILRRTLARHGDAGKPVWITEMGWSTSKIEWPSEERGMMRGAFKALGLAGRAGLRVLAIEQSHPGETDSWYSEVWRHELPEGTDLVNCTYTDVAERLDEGGWDAVVMPVDESFPAHAAERLAAYVKGGGCLVDFGGVPGYFNFGKAEDGSIVSGPNGNEDFRKSLRIKSVWKGCDASAPMNGFDTGADGVKTYPGWRSFADDYLQPGDTMKPMMLSADGIAVAALYEFDSDFKGKIFAAGRSIAMTGCATSERTQAAMTVRSAMTALHFGVERYFVYEFQSMENSPTDSESHFGLLRRDYTPKPAFHAYKTLIGLWPEGSVQVGREEWSRGGVYRVAWRRPDGSRVAAYWTGETARDVPRASLPEGDIVDMFGKPVETSGTVRVSGDPIYIVTQPQK